MAFSDFEQYMLELINRARLDPISEAARLGIDLNEGLAPSTLDGTQKQPLAHNDFLELASINHSDWMIANNIFDHAGEGESTPGDRMEDAGYEFTGFWNWGENISWRGTTGTPDLLAFITHQHEGLFLSPGHRENILNGVFQELGLAQVEGPFTHTNDVTYNVSMVTQSFARSGNQVFVTGVIFSDEDDDGFYSPGEGLVGATVSSGDSTVASMPSGGYALSLAATPSAVVSISNGEFSGSVDIDLSQGNAKIDLLDNEILATSSSLTIVDGFSIVRLLGVADADVNGNDQDNELIGNTGDNELVGGWGDDTLVGDGGTDILLGGLGSDLIHGGSENDLLQGESGADTLLGGGGEDELFGGDNSDRLFGGAGADSMDGGENSDTHFVDGQDIITDTGTIGYDKAQINDAGGVALDLTGWSGVERINGFSGDDTIDASSSSENLVLSGDAGADSITGGSGNDILLGGPGNDTLSGGGGNDTILGGTEDDLLEGGEGNDVFFVGETFDAITDGGAGFDKAVINNASGLSIAIGTWVGVERINGFTGNDTIDATGLASGITIASSDGADEITGGSAGDIVYAGTGADNVNGGAGADALIGSVGNDTLNGGTGNDFLLGGADADVFVFDDSFGLDVVKDYTDGIDSLDFSLHSGVTGFGDFVVKQVDSHTVITLIVGGTDRITLADTTATDIDAGDFGFA